MLTRWDQWYTQDNLSQDERILAAPPSQCVRTAVAEFLARGKHRVLDLACGVGRDTFHLEKHGLAVTGVDASLNGLRAVSQIKLRPGAHIPLAVADARFLPFGNGSFEGVYCFGLLHEFVGATAAVDVRQVIGEIERVLQPAGCLVLAAAGEPAQGLPHLQMFTEAMFDAATHRFECVEKRLYDDVGCTGRIDYKVWRGTYLKAG